MAAKDKMAANVFDERRADKNYLTHRRRMTQVTAMVDHHPPPLLTAFYMKVSNLNEGERRQRYITYDNRDLVKAINMINRTKGKTDTHLRPYVRLGRFDETAMRQALRIEKENKEYFEAIQNTVAVTGFWNIYAEWLRKRRVIREQSRYPWDESRSAQLRLRRRWTVERLPCADGDLRRLRGLRPRVFLEFSTSDQFLGRVEVTLYADAVPVTSAHFLELVRGAGGLGYRGTPVFRINPDLYCQGGDVTNKTGIASHSLFGAPFQDENFKLQHGGRGVLSLCNACEENNNGSQFLITFRALPTLDGRNVVFGKVTRGLGTLYAIESLGSRSGKPRKEVLISGCGVVHPGKPPLTLPTVTAPESPPPSPPPGPCSCPNSKLPRATRRP